MNEEKYREAAKVVNTTHEGIIKELKNWIEADITETILLTPAQIKELPIEMKQIANTLAY